MAFQVCFRRAAYKAMVQSNQTPHIHHTWINGLRAIHQMIRSSSLGISKEIMRLSRNPLRLKEIDRSQIRHSYDTMLFCSNRNEWQFTQFYCIASTSLFGRDFPRASLRSHCSFLNRFSFNNVLAIEFDFYNRFASETFWSKSHFVRERIYFVINRQIAFDGQSKRKESEKASGTQNEDENHNHTHHTHTR